MATTAVADRGNFANYEKALRAIRFKQWQEAADSLRQALAENPDEIAGPVTRPYGMHFEPYLPHFYMGLAQCKLGRPEDALEHWRRSDEQGVLQQAQNASELLDQRQQCEVTFLPQALEETRRTQNQARRSLESLRETGASPGAQDAMLSEQSNQLITAFETVEQTFEKLASDPPVHEVVALTAEYRKLDQAADALRHRIEQASRAAAEIVARALQTALTNFRQEMEQTRTAAKELEAQLAIESTPLPQELEHRIREVVQRVLQMDQALSATELDQAPLERLQTWRQQWTHLRSSIANLSQRVDSSRLPRELLDAASALFAGNYASTLESLNRRSFPRPRSAAQAALLRAAAHHALYFHSAGADTQRLQQARSEIERCRRTDPLLVPDARFFSPRFRQLFNETTAR